MPDWYTGLKDVLIIVTPVAVAWFGVRGSREFTAIREEVLKAKDEQKQAVERELAQIKALMSKELWDYLQRQKEQLDKIVVESRADADKHKQLSEQLQQQLEEQIDKSAGDAKQISFLQEVLLKIQEQGSLATERWMEKSEQVRTQRKELETLRESLLATARFQVHGARVVIGKPPPLDTPSDQHDLIEKMKKNASADPTVSTEEP
jgi:small-conductance mechanosensitive channel